MRHRPGADPDFDAQMLPVERRLAWLNERRRTMWAMAPKSVRERWMRAWLGGPHHFTLEDRERARRLPPA